MLPKYQEELYMDVNWPRFISDAASAFVDRRSIKLRVLTNLGWIRKLRNQ